VARAFYPESSEGQPAGVGTCKDQTPQAEEAAEKLTISVILSEAKNLSSI
jgi:hypothetical protein